jgi:NADPH2:quinone reductase
MKTIEEIPAKMQGVVLVDYDFNLIKAIKQKIEARELKVPVPKENEVLIKIAAAPCNPSDIAFMRNLYAVKKTTPTVMGFEGAGIVVGAGKNAEDMLGKKVSCYTQKDINGTWAEYFCVNKESCILLKEDMPLEQGASFFVNPFTAYGLVEFAKKHQPKAIIQNAAMGQVARFVSFFLKKENIPLINIVRKPKHVEELKEKGANFVLNSGDENFTDELNNLAHELNATVAFDAVAGNHSGDLLNNMPENSRVIVYGGLSGNHASGFDALDLIFNNKKVQGFNLNQWLELVGSTGFNEVSSELQDIIIRKEIETVFQKKFPYEQAPNALIHYITKMSKGKILLHP